MDKKRGEKEAQRTSGAIMNNIMHDIDEVLLSMAFLKARKNRLSLEVQKQKSKTKQEQIRDEINELRMQFACLLYENYSSISILIERISDVDSNYFNIMAPMGGGYYVEKGTSLHCYQCRSGVIDVVFQSYIGYLNLWNDPCGMDNLKRLLNSDRIIGATIKTDAEV